MHSLSDAYVLFRARRVNIGGEVPLRRGASYNVGDQRNRTASRHWQTRRTWTAAAQSFARSHSLVVSQIQCMAELRKYMKLLLAQ